MRLPSRARDRPRKWSGPSKRTSADDVNRAARKYVDMEHAVVAVLTPESSGKATAARTHGPGVESFTPTHVKPVKLPPWVEKTLTRLEIPKSGVNPSVTVLPNGLTLIVQPESVSDTVSVYGRVRSNSDMETPEGKKGVDEVLEQLFSYGTATLDRVAFQKALDEIGAQESAGADFGLKVLAAHFRTGHTAPCRQPAQPRPAGRGLQDRQATGRGHCRRPPRKPGLPHEEGFGGGPLSKRGPLPEGSDP